jgi:FlaA1/EpsC-like NDP-sugar epimerase
MLVLLCYYVAYLLRFNFKIPEYEVELMPRSIVTLLLIRVTGFILFKTYTGMIAYTSTEDAQRLFITITLGTLAAGLCNFAAHEVGYPYLIPFSVLLIEYLAELVFSTGYRLAIKILYLEIAQASKEKLNIIIFGADINGSVTKRTLEHDSKHNYNVVAFIDTKPQLIKQQLEGVRIYDAKQDLESLLTDFDVKAIVLARWEIPASLKRSIVETCLKHQVKVLHTPPSSQWMNGTLKSAQIREVRIEELLERDPIQLDLDKIKQQVTGKTILITGAAGSIGSEIVRQLAGFNPGMLVLMDQAETPLYELENELRAKYSNLNYEIVIGDVCNKERMVNVFNTFKPELVYHAAAYKHVPMMETNPSEALYTNILGTKICADLAVQFGADKFVLVSTDKAVNPTNVMGASKRIAEIYVQSLDKHLVNTAHTTRFITTRFGNVLGSNGSVIPLFRKQLEAGGPLTVTHPEVTRYFMTIPEACQLVLEAGAIGQGGEIFIFDMGEPVRIADLANKMIALSGLEAGKDIDIVYTGLRPGEKLYEELLNNGENTTPTHHPKIMIARVREYSYNEVKQNIESLIGLFAAQDNIRIVSAMKAMVPEYISNNSEYEQLDKRVF